MNNNMNIYDNIKDLRDADSFKDARVFHNDYDDIKLTNFGFNMRMSSIMGTLATSGIVYSTIGVLGAITLLSLPADLELFHHNRRNNYSGELGGWMIAAGIGLLFASVAWFYLCCKLRLHHKERNLLLVTNKLKSICYIEAAISITYLVAFDFFAIGDAAAICSRWRNCFPGFAVIGIPISVFLIIPVALKIHGIRSGRSGFLIPYLIIKYFLFALAILAVLGVSIWKAAYDKKFVLFLAGIGKMMLLFYIFTHMIGFTVVLYSIIKHNRKQRQPSAPNTSI